MNVSDDLIHGINTFNVYFPQKYWPGGATISDVNLDLLINGDILKETFEVYIDDSELTLSWSPYLNVFPWLHDEGAPLSHDGSKSMGLAYLCSEPPYFGTVTHEFSPYEDWTAFEGFGFYLKGKPSNEAEKLKAALYPASTTGP